jgi:hypothetical protein
MDIEFVDLGETLFQSPFTEHLNTILFKIVHSEENIDDAVSHNTLILGEEDDALMFSSTRKVDKTFVVDFLDVLDDYGFPWRDLYDIANAFENGITMYYIGSKDNDPDLAKISIEAGTDQEVNSLVSQVLKDHAKTKEPVSPQAPIQI